MLKSLQTTLARVVEIGRVVLLSAVSELRHQFTRYRSGAPVPLGDIDVVYLWCDPSEPEWSARRAAVLAAESKDELCQINLPVEPPPPALGEFRYSLRSVVANLKGLRNIYVVVDKQVPDWLDTEHPQIKLIEVEDIVADPEHYPNYNTQAIESYFHRIPDLSERFIYINDDFFLKQPTEVSEFFTADGLPRVRLGRAVAHSGVPGPGEEGDAAGHMNANRLLNASFGRRTRLTIMHRPYAHTKSMLAYVEERFPEAIESTRSSRFRSPSMYAIHSFLVPYAAYHAGCADLVPPHLLEKDMYHWSSDPAVNEKVSERIRGSKASAFCMQESRAEGVDPAAVRGFVEFMESLYPEASPFEKTEPESTR